MRKNYWSDDMKFNSLKQWYKEVLKPYFKDTTSSMTSFKYSREVTIVLTIAVAGLAGWWGYKWWNQQREAAAQKSFSECLYTYQEALQGKDESWSNAATLLGIGYEQHKSSALAPYFLVFCADALFKDGQKEEALEKLDRAIQTLPKSSPLLSLYKTKQALIHLDDSWTQEAGLQELKALADDEGNSNRDMALYYLGLYYWTQDKVNDAQMIWQQLVDAFKHEKFGASPWAARAKTKLETIA